MSPSWLRDWVRRRRLRDLRAMMRGYRLLREDKRLDLIDTVKDRLAHTSLIERAGGSPLGIDVPDADRSLRQYLLVRIGSISLNTSLLKSVGRDGAAVAHAMPVAWRRVVEEAGFKVDHVRSALLWQGYIFLLWGFGVLEVARQGARAVRSRSGKYLLARTAYFDRLTPGNLPTGADDSRDIMSWYALWSGRAGTIETLTHDAAQSKPVSARQLPLRAVGAPVPPIALRSLPRLLGWALLALLKALVGQATGQWWKSVLLREVVLAKTMSLASRAQLPEDYLFHNSGWLYRPLWSYAAERKGSRILFYFYSTNCEVFKRASGYPLQTGHWELCSWPNYLVWDEPQADFVRRAVGETAISVVGQIWFSDTSVAVPAAANAASIAVFDVQPMRPSYYQSLAIGFEYYVARNANAFLLGIDAAADTLEAQLFFKRKRDIGRRLDPIYSSLAESLTGTPRWVEVNPAVSADRLIEQADIVISAPFTSTALIAAMQGKPSCYFDPSGLLQPDDRAAHGLPLIQSSEALRDWIIDALREAEEGTASADSASAK